MVARHHPTGYVETMRMLVRILIVILLGVLAVILIGELSPEGSFLNELGQTFLDGLRLRWFPSFAF